MKIAVAFGLLVATACSQEAATPKSKTAPSRQESAVVHNQAPLAPADVRPSTAEDSIDPKSAQGAAQVVQRYFALVETGKLAEANRLWSVGVERLDMSGYGEVHASVGAPGPIEGGAGSLYVEVPVQLYGRLKNGTDFSSPGVMTLRRVNDVPGSTEQQRRWHIWNAEFAG